MAGCADCTRKDAQLAVAVVAACLLAGGVIGLVLAVLADEGKLRIPRLPRIAVAVVRPVPDFPDEA